MNNIHYFGYWVLVRSIHLDSIENQSLKCLFLTSVVVPVIVVDWLNSIVWHTIAMDRTYWLLHPDHQHVSNWFVRDDNCLRHIWFSKQQRPIQLYKKKNKARVIFNQKSLDKTSNRTEVHWSENIPLPEKSNHSPSPSERHKPMCYFRIEILQTEEDL